jgi:hypothetical protein
MDSNDNLYAAIRVMESTACVSDPLNAWRCKSPAGLEWDNHHMARRRGESSTYGGACVAFSCPTALGLRTGVFALLTIGSVAASSFLAFVRVVFLGAGLVHICQHIVKRSDKDKGRTCPHLRHSARWRRRPSWPSCESSS